MHTKNCYWLNNDSRKFLSRGYLLENETPEQRDTQAKMLKAIARILTSRERSAAASDACE